MHEMEFGKSNSLSDQSAAPCTKRKMVAFNVFRILFSGFDGTLSDMFLICVIAIGINRVDMERSQQSSQLVQIFVFTRTKTIG